MAKYTGAVKWYNTERGYGFISCNEGNDVFVHHSQLKEKGAENNLNEGETLTFDIQENERGTMAINVQKL